MCVTNLGKQNLQTVLQFWALANFSILTTTQQPQKKWSQNWIEVEFLKKKCFATRCRVETRRLRKADIKIAFCKVRLVLSTEEEKYGAVQYIHLERTATAWRTSAYQEVILRIGPLGKLGCFESTAEIVFVYNASISLVSGPILSITSWYAKVLHGYCLRHSSHTTF